MGFDYFAYFCQQYVHSIRVTVDKFKLDLSFIFKTKTNVPQTMEAALKNAPTHGARTVAPVEKDSHWLLMQSLAQVMYSS